MKTFLKIIASLVILLIIFVVLIFFFTAGAADAADAYLKSGDTEHVANGFSDAGVNQNAIQSYKSVNWDSRSVSDKSGSTETASLKGTVTTHNDEKIRIKVDLVKENDEWKVLSISGE